MKWPVDEIREVGSRYVCEALREGLQEVTIVAGDVVHELGLRNRTPSVCEALVSKRFLNENGLSLERSEGPPSGHSTSMKYTYRLQDVICEASKPKGAKTVSLLSLRGAGKQVYKAPDGGEAFLITERAEFDPR
jgi:hypothetical protein